MARYLKPKTGKMPAFMRMTEREEQTQKRGQTFNAMIQDALAGKIDMILTKLVSRFARNTVDSLVTIRKLKEKNVAVVFEKE